MKLSNRIIGIICAAVMIMPCAAFADTPDEETNYISNGSFETDIWEGGNGWNVEVPTWMGSDHESVGCKSDYIKSGEKSFHFWFNYANTVTLTQDVELPEGQYDLSGYIQGEGADTVISVKAKNAEEAIYEDTVTQAGWANWVCSNGTFEASEGGQYVLTIAINCAPGAYGDVDDFTLRVHSEETVDPEPEYNKVKIQPVEGLSEDFMRGVDVSSIVSLENAGVKFYNQEGVEEDIFKILHDSGVNTIRVRVWNDPYDKNGQSYGGGNNDLETAKIIAKRAADNDLKVYVDFHYSDFWAAPGKQEKPKAWKKLNTADTAKAIKEYTTDALTQLQETGAQITLIQIGNETSGAFCGSKKWSIMTKYFKAGIKAARAVVPDAKIMIQFGGSKTVSKYDEYCKYLKKYKVDYDVLGASYYPFYKSSGTPSNLTKRLNNIIKKYGKEVMVVENAYPVAFEDFDGQGNNFSYEDYAALSKQMPWEISTQGQAQEIRDVIEIVNNLRGGKGTGYCYWEPAWITVGDTSELTGDAWQEQYDKNYELWETYGCGWASSHVKGYYSVKNYADSNAGGSTWENVAMFDQTGRALDSLNVFKYIYTGSEGDGAPSIVDYDEPTVTLAAGADLTEDEVWRQIWWNQINCKYSDDNEVWTDVKWINEDGDAIVKAYQKKKLGTYTFHGTTRDFNHKMVTMKVVITGDNDYIKKCVLSKTKYTYNGKKCKPSVKVVNLKGTKLVKGKNYKVTYDSDCKSVGTHQVIVKGIGKYSFEFVLEYEIAPKTKK